MKELTAISITSNKDPVVALWVKLQAACTQKDRNTKNKEQKRIGLQARLHLEIDK